MKKIVSIINVKIQGNYELATTVGKICSTDFMQHIFYLKERGTRPPKQIENINERQANKQLGIFHELSEFLHMLNKTQTLLNFTFCKKNKELCTTSSCSVRGLPTGTHVDLLVTKYAYLL